MFRSCCSRAQFLLTALLLLAMLSGCASKNPRKHWWEFWKPKSPAKSFIGDETPFAPPPDPSFPNESGRSGEMGDGTGSIQSITGPDVAGGIPGTDPPRMDPAGPIPSLPTIYFAFDSDQISPSEKEVLDRCVAWLLAKPEVIVQAEGHCDERGTSEYNINLGQRRADRVREYLVQQGVNPAQLVTISYGEDRPIDFGKTEEAYQKNRRVQFLVYE